MTPQEEMQKIVEAAGECWHVVEESVGETMGHYYHQCIKCGIHDRRGNIYPNNPSPTDLNELFRLAEEIFGEECEVSFYISEGKQIAQLDKIECLGQGFANNKADALRKALVKAIEGKE